MKKYSIFFLAIGLLYTACTPKATSVLTEGPTMKAPKIEIPSGDNIRATAPKPGTPPSIQVGKANTSTLSNGIQVIVVENHKLPRVSFQMFIDNDPVLEGNAAGYLDMMGDLLSKGTTTRSKSEIDEAIDFIGARMSTSSRGVRGESLTKHADALLRVMSDVLLNPSFPEEEFEKAKTRAASGLAQAKEDPNSIASNVRSVLNFGKNHPYGETMTEASLENISVSQMKDYYTKYFKPNNAYFVVVGDVTPKQAQVWANQHFGTWAKGDVPTNTYPKPSAPAKSSVDLVNKAGAVQSVINITYPVDFQPNSDDAIKARVMNTVLGAYFNSRVNANLREDKAYTYGAKTNLNSNELIGSFNAYASVRNEVTDSSIQEFLYEIKRLRDEPMPADELSLVKNVLTGSFARNLEQPETVARFALNTARYNLPADYYETYLTKLAEVNVADIQAMAKKYLQPDNAHILVVGNKSEIADKLGHFGKINNYDVYGTPIVDMSSSIPSEHTAKKVIQDYINAIGGQAKLDAIKDYAMTGRMEGMGMPITMNVVKKTGNKMMFELTMNDQVLNRQVVNGDKATMQNMGGAAEPVPAEGMEDMAAQAAMFREANYKKLGYFSELVSAEKFNGQNAFVLKITAPSGKTSTEYYSMSSGLKIGEVSEQDNGEETVTITTSYDEYAEYGGVKFPKTTTVSGAFPMPMKMVVDDLKVNTGVTDDAFSFE